MAWGTVETLLPPLRWAEIMGVSPWDFCQMDIPEIGACQDTFYQFQWQKNFLSRAEISRAIADAESLFASKMGFWPAPKYIEADIVQYPQAGQRPWHFNRDTFGDHKAVPVHWGYVQGGGKLTRTLITANVPVTVSDEDNDSINDTFTLTVNTTVTNPAEIGVYVMLADRMNRPISELWRLRPLEITFSAGVATIKGFVGLLLQPKLAWAAAPNEQAPDAPSLLTNVDVYRVYRDTTHTDETPNQGYAIWERLNCEPDEDCVLGTSAVCIGDKLARLKQVFVDFDPCELEFYPSGSMEPQRLSLNYQAGYPLDSMGQMDSQMADIVAYLATALLPELPCGCERAAQIIAHWRGFAALEGEGARFMAQEELNNPFGPQRGAVYAWRRVADMGISETVSV